MIQSHEDSTTDDRHSRQVLVLLRTLDINIWDAEDLFDILDVDEINGATGAYRYDHDNDGIWDATDNDDDNDGLLDWFEQNDGNSLTGQFDHDNDGLDDNEDDDDDDDGILDELEA